MITRVVVRVERVRRKAGVEWTWTLSGRDISLRVSPGIELHTNQLTGATKISLRATLLGDNSWERHLTQKAVAGQLRFKDLMLEMNEGEDGKEEEKRQGSNDEDWNPIGKSHQRVEKGSSQAICGCGDEEKEVIREVKPQTVFFYSVQNSATRCK